MDNKQAFSTWTPARAWAWTRFAKASLFANERPFQPNPHSRDIAAQLVAADLPFDLRAYDYRNTIVIIDLPGEESVQFGLKLYMQSGLQPIPLFNVVTGSNTGDRSEVVDTSRIIRALAAGTQVLEISSSHHSEFATFLLDYYRDNQENYGPDVYDNRWNVTENDLPDSAYLTGAGVTKVLYVTAGTPHNDIAEILSAYQRSGINVQIYQDGQFSDWLWHSLELKDVGANAVAPGPPAKATLEQRWHTAQTPLTWLFGVLAAISALNWAFQWNSFAPLFWTVPAAQWLVYDILPENIGDIFLIALTLFNVGIWFAVKSGFYKAVRVGWYAFVIDALWFFGYAFSYGLMAFAETPGYAFFAYGLPLALGGALFAIYRKFRRNLNSDLMPGWYNIGQGEQRYWDGLAWADKLRYTESDDNDYAYYTLATRPTWVRTTPVRGFSGYGGTGRGGYGSHSGYGSLGG